MEDAQKQNPIDWITGSDTGISSSTIWAVMMGANVDRDSFNFDTPHDPSDFGRCYRLLNLFPEWRQRLGEVAAILPKWGPMVREWDRLTEIYERELPNGKAPQLYKLMQELIHEGLIADGWKKTGPGSWERRNHG